MQPLKSNCSCFSPGSVWVTQPPEVQHDFKVICAGCRKYIKWGNKAELNRRQQAGDKIWIEGIAVKPESYSIDELFEDDGDV